MAAGTRSDTTAPPARGDGGPAPAPSKSALKRQAHELQHLGADLAALADEQLAALPMPEALLQAVVTLKRTRSHEGRRRQLQYVGKLMRRADVQPLAEAVAGAQLGPAQDALALHLAERWREELARDDGALTRWLTEHPQSDARRLRSLVRNARHEAALPPEQRHGTAWRELFRFIRPHVGASRDD
jgi:ribosome-associated protein